jgi:hypothetical protein
MQLPIVVEPFWSEELRQVGVGIEGHRLPPQQRKRADGYKVRFQLRSGKSVETIWRY